MFREPPFGMHYQYTKGWYAILKYPLDQKNTKQFLKGPYC